MNLWKGLAAGVISGILASAAMNLLTRHRPHGAQARQQGLPQHGVGDWQAQRGETDPDEDAAERTANLLAGGKLTREQKHKAGVAVHYAFGASTAALYGMLAELAPEAAPYGGIPFGLAVWLLADEGAVPLLGLSKRPDQYSPEVHAYSLAAHCVFGLTTELTRGVLRVYLNGGQNHGQETR